MEIDNDIVRHKHLGQGESADPLSAVHSMMTQRGESSNNTPLLNPNLIAHQSHKNKRIS